MFDQFEPPRPLNEALGFSEYGARMPAAEVFDIRFSGSAQQVLGALGLEGTFAASQEGPRQLDQLEANRTEWNGTYVEDGHQMPATLSARTPGAMVSRVAGFFGQEAQGEVNARIFWGDKKPAASA